VPTEHILSEAVTSMLDCREREQAVAATNEAVRGGVGTTATWRSDTRPNVSGASTVTGQTAANGGECLTVSDLIIVEGQETRVPKTMCRRPPSNRYVRV
jgi:surface antigen